MKFIFAIACTAALLLAGVFSASAQEAQEVQHPHSVTVSTGIPFILAMMYPPGSGDNGMTMDGWSTGLGYKTWLSTNLNVGYNYQVDRRWEMSFLVTVCGYVYSRYSYPLKGVDEHGLNVYDWKAEPENQGVHYDLRAVMPTLMLRYYWLARNPSFQMYSAIGVAYLPKVSGIPPAFPTLTPLGIRFGGGHWYGVAELTAGTTATLLLAGVGYRF